MTWTRNSRNVITDAHLRRRCPICLEQIEADHQEARILEALRLAVNFAQYGKVLELHLEQDNDLVC